MEKFLHIHPADNVAVALADLQTGTVVSADGVAVVLKEDIVKDAWKTENLDEVTRQVLGAEFIWGEDLNEIPGLSLLVTEMLTDIYDKGMYQVVKAYVG